MGQKARLSVLALCFALFLQSCGASVNEPDSQATVAIAIQRTLTAQSISITATSLVFSRMTPSPTHTLSLPFEIPGSGGLPNVTPLPGLPPTESPSPIPNTSTPTGTPSQTPTATLPSTPIIIPSDTAAFGTHTPPPTVTLPGSNAATATRQKRTPATLTLMPFSATPAPVISSPSPVQASPQIPPTGGPTLSVNEPTNCRAGPGMAYDLLGYLYPGDTVAVVGYDPALNYWILLHPRNNQTCWVWGGYATVQGNTATLPTVVPPPPPEIPRITVSTDTPCRSGPSRQYTVLGTLAANASADMTGRLSSSNWWLISNPSQTGYCWLPGDQATITGNIQALPVLDTIDGTVTPTPAPTATVDPSAYTCNLVSQAVKNGTILKPGADFDGNWVLKNTGSAAWDPSSVNYRYVNGTEMYKHNAAYPLQKRVEPGQKIRILVDMRAPKNPGQYTTIWGLSINGQIFCEIPLSINVIQP